MTEENNILVISYPMGGKGHIAGRLLASCNNVEWYDSEVNGEQPWIPYNDIDKCFTPFHFNRKFAGAARGVFCDKTVMGVLDIVDRNQTEQTIFEQKQNISEWKKRLYPNHLIYTNHSDFDKTVAFFGEAKHVLILPDNVEKLLERFKNTTINYFISRNNKEWTFGDYYTEQSKKYNISVDDCIRKDLQTKIENFEKYKNLANVVITDVDNLLEESYFKNVCKQLSLEFNSIYYNHVRTFVKNAR